MSKASGPSCYREVEGSAVSTPIAKFELPLPPSVNHSYTPIGDTIISKKVLRQFKADAHILLNNQYQLLGRDERVNLALLLKEIKRCRVPLALDILFYLEDAWRRDEDNGVKPVQDAIFKHLHLNDNHVFDLHVQKRQDKSNPRCEVTVYLWQEDAA